MKKKKINTKFAIRDVAKNISWKIFVTVFIMLLIFNNNSSAHTKNNFSTYLGIDKIAIQYNYFKNDSLFVSFGPNIFPLELVSPIAYKIGEDFYNQGNIYEWNLWNIISGPAGKPYHFKIFHGTNVSQKKNLTKISGNYFAYSTHYRFGKHIYQLSSFEFGYESSIIKHYSEINQEIKKIQFSFLLFGKDFDEQIMKFQYNKKGMIPDIIPFIDMKKLMWKTKIHWSVNTRFHRDFELYVERPFVLPIKKYFVYFTVGIGSRIFTPYTIYFDEKFQVESSGVELEPVIDAGISLLNKNK
ncbi:MAG: hypothetical protein U9N76_00150 [Candidatus Marinimicrobia bacterium]|nr:hypothetical protein [Candidatus Neomarinimicrobiota bacterium]